jgi:exodeoxyribonuclease VII small subunit
VGKVGDASKADDIGEAGAVSKTAAAGETLGYEQARDELVEVVRRLEAGGVGLEESLTLWERGEALATLCEQWLAGARARLEAVRQGGEVQGD